MSSLGQQRHKKGEEGATVQPDLADTSAQGAGWELPTYTKGRPSKWLVQSGNQPLPTTLWLAFPE